MKKKITFFVAAIISVTTLKAQWQLTGNSITSTNFLGSTNAQPLVFKVNNYRSGLIDYDITKANTLFGYQALLSNTGSNNTAFGYKSLYSNTSGTANNAIGGSALFSNTTGSFNTANGNGALEYNINGIFNSAFGYLALYSNTSGSENVASGWLALSANNIGNTNVAYGARALGSNTSGHSNVSIGIDALYSNQIGSNNIAIGDSALYHQTPGYGPGTAYPNTAIGSKALFSTSTGYGNVAVGEQSLYLNTQGESNTAVGLSALYNNTTGVNNVALGVEALDANTTGGGNTAIGAGSLPNLTTGSNNVGINGGNLLTTGFSNIAIGYNSGENNSSGDDNVSIGEDAGSNGSNYNNSMQLGYLCGGSASNQVRIGNNSVTSIGGYVGWTNISDGRVKRNIKENIPGLIFINKLKPISYNLDLDAADKILQRPSIRGKDGKIIQPSQEELEARKAKEQIVYNGFIAQDVEKVAKSINYDFSGVDAAKNNKDLYGLRYSDFVVPLVKAVQELSEQNDSLKVSNQQLQTQMDNIIQRMNSLELVQQNLFNSLSQNDAQKSKSLLINSSVFLEQNTPNPYNSSTIIRYHLPSTATNAQLIITDINGHNLKSIYLNQNSNQVSITAGTFSAGTYLYSLVIDGKNVDSKQMVITK